MPVTFSKKRNVDIVFCIDSTGSMSPIIDLLKSSVSKFQTSLIEGAEKESIEIGDIRIKLISFRDYENDGDEAMSVSRFFDLPDDEAEYSKELHDIEATGGGDNPENGLEALYLAMKSDFVKGKDDRQVVFLFTDDDAVPLKDAKRVTNPTYPKEMADDVDDLLSLWEKTGKYAQDSTIKLGEKQKRLVVYAPEKTIYQEFCNRANGKTFYNTSKFEAGMKEITYDDVIKMLVCSISS